MAMIRTKEKKELILELDGGVVNGKQKLVQKRFSNIVSNASDEKIYTVAIAIVGLQEKSLLKVNVRDTDLLTEE